MSMRFTSSISDAVNASAAADSACRQVLDQLSGLRCDLAFVFTSTIYRVSWPDLSPTYWG